MTRERLLRSKPALLVAASLCASASAQAADLPALIATGLPQSVAAPPLRLTMGLRSWYSWEQIRYGFYNHGPRAGNPSSKLDWTGLEARSGEAVVRIDHPETGLFLRAMGGIGSIGRDGRLLDRDFYAGQVSFSATSSDVDGAGLDYAVVDLGAEISPFPGALPDLEIAPFVGYHRWDDAPAVYGVFCEPSAVPRPDCAVSATGVLYGPDVKALGYRTRWDALRIGVGASVGLLQSLTLRGEAAWVPYARYAVDDSHYLRQDPDPRLGLGAVPNVFVRGAGQGIEAEAFLDYALSGDVVLGIGGRYWGLRADDGSVHNRLSATRNPVTLYDQERYGLLVEARHAF